MKPKVIYLQDGGVSYDSHGMPEIEVTWCHHQIEDDDTAYVSVDLVHKLTDAVYHERNMVCQDMDLQLQASQAVDDALAAALRALK